MFKIHFKHTANIGKEGTQDFHHITWGKERQEVKKNKDVQDSFLP